MSALYVVITALIAVAVAEAITFAVVHWLRRRCQWLITPGDLEPPIDEDGLRRFLDHGWDPHLGWTRKPNTSHDEEGKDGSRSRYHIDQTGARRNPGFEGRLPQVLIYGDSYAFCRQVDDDETWAHGLSHLLGVNVANFGVGNYGLDQAVLRLEREFDQQPAPVVLMAVVPETICRVLGTWRHFSEYGNTFAFKPRFVLVDGKLELIPNPIKTPETFHRISELLGDLKAADEFYLRKFQPDMLRFPYLWHLWRSRRRNVPLLAAALADRLLGDDGRAFCRVMERNIDIAAALYGEVASLELLTAVVDRFAAFIRSKGAEPALVILPQLYDLKRLRIGDHYYRPLLERIADTMPAIDLGPVFAAANDDAANYINDRFGGHLSTLGNRIAAAKVAEVVAPMLNSVKSAKRPTAATAADGAKT